MKILRRQLARGMDFTMCAMMDRIQRHHRLPPESRAAFQTYLDECAPMTPEDYFSAPPMEPEREGGILRWKTPHPSGFVENDRAHALLFQRDPARPTVLMLHALMSSSDAGYRLWAARFDAAGWNACFLHLPYHYSRTPPGARNGELAISPDLVRNGQGLRQGVAEARQLMAWLRAQGTREFGLWATSYGGWIGALLLGLEADFRFAVLMAPIVSVQHAIWQSGTGRHLRSELVRCGITREMVARHEHLTFPFGVRPRGAGRILLGAGLWDRIVRLEDVERLHRAWPGSELFTVEQGHFGLRMAEEAFRLLMSGGTVDRVPEPILAATRVKPRNPFSSGSKLAPSQGSR